MLESFQHESSFFVTLTYDQDHLPPDGSVSVRAAQLFLKRLRKAAGSAKLRYYIVGEYGEKGGRPHYHAAIFGLPVSGVYLDSRSGRMKHRLIDQAWRLGLHDCGTLTADSAGYIVSYIVKGLTKDALPDGRAPEFARMSRRPGIGFPAVAELSRMMDKHWAAARDHNGDVPNALRYLGKLLPIGRYLKEKVRKSLGIEKRPYTREDMPIDVKLLQKAFALRDPKEREILEARRYRSTRRINGRLSISNQRKVL